jgi:hypothetical protein
VLLFKLGYAERDDLGVVPSSGSLQTVLTQAVAAAAKPSFVRSLLSSTRVEPPVARSVLQVCVLGDNGVGKSSFVWQLTGMRAPGLVGDNDLGVQYAKFSEAVVVGGWTVHSHHSPPLHVQHTPRAQSHPGSGSNLAHLSMKSGVAGTSSAGGSANTADAQPTTRALLRTVLTEPYHVSVAAVPLDQAEAWLDSCAESCDLAVLMFQCANMQSLRTAIGLDARLPPHVPRLFLASKSDTIPSAQVMSLGVHSPSGSRGEFGNTTRTTREALKSAHESVLQEASLHLQTRGLRPLALVSTLSGEGVAEAQTLMLDVATDPERGLPKDKPKAAQSFAITLSTVASAAAIFTVVGSLTVGLLWHFNPRVKEVLNEWWASVRKFIRQQQQQLAIAN